MPELQTTLEGVAPWLSRPDNNELANRSFLSAFEEAQQEKSPMYRAQVQQVQQQNALFPLRQQQLQMQAQEAVLAMDTAQNARVDRLKTKDTMAKVAGMLAHVEDWSNADSDLAQIGNEIAKNWTPDLQKYYDGAIARSENAKKLKLANTIKEDQIAASRERNELLLQKAALEAEIKRRGQEVDLIKKQADIDVKLEQLKSAGEKQTPQQKERQDYVALTTKEAFLNKQLAKPEDEYPGQHQELQDQLNETRRAIQAWESQHPGGQNLTLTTDAQGNVQVQMGSGKIQAGAQAAIQKELADLKNSVVQIDRASSVLTEKDLGVSGWIWDDVINKWVSQVAPEAGDFSVSANRVQAQKAVDTYLQTQVAKGRLSSREREEIRGALVTRGKGESIGRAKAILANMSKIQKLDAVAKAKTGHQGLESWMFQDLTQADIRQLFQEGVLTKEEALNWALQAKSRN